jgi:hypothetical protein
VLLKIRMKSKTKILSSLIIATVAGLFFAGCVATVPPSSPGQPESYTASPQITNAQAKVDSVIQSAAPLLSATPAAPVVPFVQPVADSAFALVTGLSALIAAWKTRQAKAHSKAAAALAAVVQTQSNGAQQALAFASQNGSSATVAQHLSDAANPVQL